MIELGTGHDESGSNGLPKIHYAMPSITEREVSYAADAARTGWGERCYDYLKRFERAFADHLGVRHAIATSSGTGALTLGLAGLGIGPGDEVILADINWIASAAPIVHLGATPVFVDILRDSWCIDPVSVEAAITPKTKAIVAVHLYGNTCDMAALELIGTRHGIPVVEDAAEAIGSRIGERRAGSIGAFGAFSFHGTKTLTTGEGGMFVTQDGALFERVLMLSNHGRRAGQARQFWAEQIGYKFKMSNIAAAIGCAQLERIDELVAGKRRVFSYYREGLAGTGIAMNPEPPSTVNGFWMPTIIGPAAFDRERLLQDFARNVIDGRVFFWPLSSLPMFEENLANTVSYDLHRRALNLPSYHDLRETDMDRVITLVRHAITN